MMRMRTMQLLAAILLAFFSATAIAADIWYEDNNMGTGGGMPSDFISKFEHPENFREAASYIDVYMVRANVLDRMSDEFLADVFGAYLRKQGIRLALDAGGANWLQLSDKRQRVHDEEIALLKRLKRLNVAVDYISLQSVLSKAPKASGEAIVYPLNKRLQDIITYAKAARSVYPLAKIGVIDALPSHGKEYRDPYQSLKVAMDSAGVPLSYIHLDIAFDIPQKHLHGVTWKLIRKVERFVEDDLGLQFGYFATSRKGGYTSSRGFHERVMGALECYTAVGGTPGDFIIASWYPYPDRTVPEDAVGDDYPAMRTVKEFGRELDSITKGGLPRGWPNQCGR